jgi:hypothetical protein
MIVFPFADGHKSAVLTDAIVDVQVTDPRF